MQVTVSKELFEIFPEAKFGFIKISELKKVENIDITALNSVINFSLSEAKKYHLKHSQLNIFKNWQNVLDKLNLNTDNNLPLHLILLKQVEENIDILTNNPLIDLIIAFSVRYKILISAFDCNNKILNISKLTNQWGISNEQDSTFSLIPSNLNDLNISNNSKEILLIFSDYYAEKSNYQIENILNEFLSTLTSFYKFNQSNAIVSRFNNVFTAKSTNKTISGSFSTYLLARPKVNNKDTSINDFFDHKLDLIYPSAEKLKSALKSGERLTFYLGADATAPKMHIGHVIPLLKLAQLKNLGHQIVFLIGDFTARIGDPTDKSATRIQLSAEQTAENAKNYLNQIKKYIDLNDINNPPRIVFNSTWLDGLDLKTLIELLSNFTVQQLIERDMFELRLKNKKPIYLHELLYPVLQGYDSLHLEVNGEFGGRDQTFNMLFGRDLSKIYKGIDKFVVTTKFLLSADKVNKMSKSLENCIYIDDTPNDKFGKVMAIPDELIQHYFELATMLSLSEINSISKEYKTAIDLKKRLAFEVVKLHHNQLDAQNALEYFTKTIQNKEVPSDITIITKDKLLSTFNGSNVLLKNLLTKINATNSNSEAKNLIIGGGVLINGQKIQEINKEIDLLTLKTLKAGKRKWYKFE